MTPLPYADRLARLIREAEELCARLEDPRRLIDVLALSTRHALSWADPPAVLAAAGRAHAVAARHGDTEQRGDAAMLLSVGCYFVGDARRGAEVGHRLIQDGLDETQPAAVFTAPRQVLARAVLAWSLIELGEFEESRRVIDEAIAFTQGRRGPYPLIIALTADGLFGLRSGNPDGAVRAFARAVELGRDAGYTQYDIPARAGVAIGRARQGEIVEAVAELEAIAAELREVKTRLWITLPALWLAEAYLRAGRAADACAQAESALRLATARGERILEGWALCLIGEIAADPKAFRPEAGLSACGAALAIAEAGGLRPLRVECERGIARLRARASQHA